MGQAFLVRRGGGVKESGGGSAFSLISVASTDDLPANADENTIAVITQQTIGKIYVLPHAPENAAVGDILVYAENPKKNLTIIANDTMKVRVGISGAYVQTDSGLEPLNTYVFIDNEWTFLWSAQIYDSGNEYADYTGGWVGNAKKSNSSSGATAKAPTIDRTNPDCIIASTTPSYGGMFVTKNKIDLTPYKEIVFDGEFLCEEGAAQNVYAGAWSTIGTYYQVTPEAFSGSNLDVESVNKIVVDVTNVNEPCYVGVGLTRTKLTLRRCYLVPKDAT